MSVKGSALPQDRSFGIVESVELFTKSARMCSRSSLSWPRKPFLPLESDQMLLRTLLPAAIILLGPPAEHGAPDAGSVALDGAGGLKQGGVPAECGHHGPGKTLKAVPGLEAQARAE